jgi:hypothetical protein
MQIEVGYQEPKKAKFESVLTLSVSLLAPTISISMQKFLLSVPCQTVDGNGMRKRILHDRQTRYEGIT